MGSDDVKRIFKPIHDGTLAAFCPRHTTMLDLHAAIVALKPDAIEISETILGACAEALRRGVERGVYEDVTEALLYASLLQKALERLDVGYQVNAADTLSWFELQARKPRLP
jgi:hypothetical protein